MKSSDTLYKSVRSSPLDKSLSYPNSQISSPTISSVTRNQLEREAATESVKEEIKSKKIHTDKLSNLVSRGRVYLYKTSAVFPFDFFPNEISIEPDQVNICIKSFFLTAESRSIPIKNIADILISTSFLFASIKIIDNSYLENSVEISYLRKNEAEKVRRIIQGLVLASKENVDLSKIDPKNLVVEAERLGKMQGMDWQIQ